MKVAQLGLFNPVFSALFISSATKAVIALEIYNPASNEIQCELEGQEMIVKKKLIPLFSNY